MRIGAKISRTGGRAFAVVACALVLALTGVRAQGPAQPPNPLEDWKPDTLHNIQVLPKDITPDALMTLMRAWNASLNVDCVFCHKGQVGKPWSTYDFADDTKKRHEVARLMAKTTIRLNEEFKDLGEMDEPTKVTCATCHRRSRHPEITPPAAPPKPAK